MPPSVPGRFPWIRGVLCARGMRPAGRRERAVCIGRDGYADGMHHVMHTFPPRVSGIIPPIRTGGMHPYAWYACPLRENPIKRSNSENRCIQCIPSIILLPIPYIPRVYGPVKVCIRQCIPHAYRCIPGEIFTGLRRKASGFSHGECQNNGNKPERKRKCPKWTPCPPSPIRRAGGTASPCPPAWKRRACRDRDARARIPRRRA